MGLGGNEKWSRVLGATVSGAIGGGVGSVLTGGNFWQGAATGAIIGLFNDSMHDEGPDKPGRRVGNSQEVRNPKTGETELLRDIESVTITVHKQQPHYWGFSANFALLGGFGISFGRVRDSYGKSVGYFSFNGNLGFGMGAGFDYGTIFPTDKTKWFKTSDFAGQGASYNKRSIIFLLSVTLIPFMLGLMFLFLSPLMDKRSRKEIFLEHYMNDNYKFKIDTIYINRQNRGAMALKNKKENIVEYPLYLDKWEKDIKVGDSIVKEKGSTKIYLYRNSKLYKVFDYNDIKVDKYGRTSQ